MVEVVHSLFVNTWLDQVLPSLSCRQYGSWSLLFIEQQLSLQSTTILLYAASLSSMKTLRWTGGSLRVQYNKIILLSPFWGINPRSQQSRGAEIMYRPGSQEETEFNSLDLNEEASLRDPLQRGGQGWGTYHRMLRHPQANTEQRTVATTRLKGVRKAECYLSPGGVKLRWDHPAAATLREKSPLTKMR